MISTSPTVVVCHDSRPWTPGMRADAAGVDSTAPARGRNARPAASRLSGCWSCESGDVDLADLVGRPGRTGELVERHRSRRIVTRLVERRIREDADAGVLDDRRGTADESEHGAR
jgi:hypothetical protein